VVVGGSSFEDVVPVQSFFILVHVSLVVNSQINPTNILKLKAQYIEVSELEIAN